MTQYSAEFKTKIVLEVLKADKTINEIESEYNIIPKNIQNWKNVFLANAVVAMKKLTATAFPNNLSELLKNRLKIYRRVFE